MGCDDLIRIQVIVKFEYFTDDIMSPDRSY